MSTPTPTSEDFREKFAKNVYDKVETIAPILNDFNVKVCDITNDTFGLHATECSAARKTVSHRGK